MHTLKTKAYLRAYSFVYPIALPCLFVCHIYNSCCLIARLYLLIELRSVVVVCLVFYPIRFASLLYVYPLRFSLMLCFVVWSLACVCWSSSMLIVVPFPFSLSFLCLLWSDHNTSLFHSSINTKNPITFVFVIGYKKTRIYSGLINSSIFFNVLPI